MPALGLLMKVIVLLFLQITYAVIVIDRLLSV